MSSSHIAAVRRRYFDELSPPPFRQDLRSRPLSFESALITLFFSSSSYCSPARGKVVALLFCSAVLFFNFPACIFSQAFFPFILCRIRYSAREYYIGALPTFLNAFFYPTFTQFLFRSSTLYCAEDEECTTFGTMSFVLEPALPIPGVSCLSRPSSYTGDLLSPNT